MNKEKTPDYYDFLYEQYKDDQMIAKFDKMLEKEE